MRGRRLRAPGLAHRAAHRHRRRRPVGPRTAGLADARGRRREPRRAVVRPARPAPRARATRATRTSCARNAGGPSPARIAGLFAGYARDRPRMLEDWAAGGDGDGAGGHVDPGPDVAAGALAPGRRGDRRAHAGAAAPRHGRRDPSRSAASPCRTGCRCSATPGWRSPSSSWSPRSRRFARSTSGCRSLPRACWDALGRDRRRWTGQRDATTPQSRPSVIRSPPRSAGTSARCNAPCRSSRARLRRRRDSRQPRAQTPSSAGSSTTSATDTVPDRDTRAARHLTTGDTSVQVHATHGIPRQVEVLRDVLTGLLQDDPTLEPRDIVVMCPDVDAYAPAITAAFGLGSVIEGGHPGHRLRVQIADRAPRTTNPVLAVAADLVGIAAGRATLSDVLALAASPTGRYRFGFDRRRPRHRRDVGPAGGDPLGAQPTAAARIPAGPVRPEHLGDRPGPADDRRGHGRARAAGRRRPAARRRRAAPTSTWPAGSRSSLARVRACVEQLQDAGPVRERLTVLRDAVLSLSDDRAVRRLAAGAVRADHGPRGGRRRGARRSGDRGPPHRPARAARRRAAAPGRPGPTSAPATSPSARWSRCARCRTASSASSASRTGRSRARRRSTATTCSPATR